MTEQHEGRQERWSISLYEVPLPSSRTRREMSTLRRHGFDIAVVHNPRYLDRITADGFSSLPANLGAPHSIVTELKRRIAAAKPGAAPEVMRSARVAEQALALPTPQLRVRPADLGVLVHNWLAAAEALARTRPHIFWAADLDALPPVVWAASLSPGSKVVFDAHELFTELDYLDPLQMGEWADIAATFVPHADVVLTVGPEIGEVFAERYGAGRVEVVPNLAEAADPSPTTVRKTLGLTADTPLAIHVGNVVPNRRPELAIELLTRRPAVHVAFVGEVRGGLERTLSSQAEELGVHDRLHFVPPVSGRQLVQFISDADVSLILYSPQRSKHLALTMPNKLYDSLAAGVPVVSTEGLAPTHAIVERALGAAFSDGDSAGLAEAVDQVLGDQGCRERVAAARTSFLWEAGEDHLVDMIRSLARGAEPVQASLDEPLRSPGPTVATKRSPTSLRFRKALGWRLRRLANYLDR